MLDLVTFMAAPFAACLVLVATLGYFGLHVLLRQVIFVDLALAQIAALGTVIALLAGHPPGTAASFAYSLVATILGAGVFTITRPGRHEAVPQEAIIGISYVIASAAAILVADRAPEGAEHIKELLAGTILWVSWGAVGRLLAVCAAVGVFHWLFRRRFLRISEHPAEAEREGTSLRLWDFLFYLSFGLVITFAVTIAGVLMVFAYLVAPAIIALTVSRSWGTRAVAAWIVGLLASASGLAFSYWSDFPSGPAVVCFLGLFLVLFAVWRKIRRPAQADAEEPLPAE